MAALHPPAAFYAGDTWEIDGALHYADGSPFNLAAGATLEWTLRDAGGAAALDLTLLNGGIAVAAAGQCLIMVTPAQSAAIAPGKYTDRLRAVDPAGFVSTQWVGTIEVRA